MFIFFEFVKVVHIQNIVVGTLSTVGQTVAFLKLMGLLMLPFGLEQIAVDLGRKSFHPLS